MAVKKKRKLKPVYASDMVGKRQPYKATLTSKPARKVAKRSKVSKFFGQGKRSIGQFLPQVVAATGTSATKKKKRKPKKAPFMRKEDLTKKKKAPFMRKKDITKRKRKA